MSRGLDVSRAAQYPWIRRVILATLVMVPASAGVAAAQMGTATPSGGTMTVTAMLESSIGLSMEVNRAGDSLPGGGRIVRTAGSDAGQSVRVTIATTNSGRPARTVQTILQPRAATTLVGRRAATTLPATLITASGGYGQVRFYATAQVPSAVPVTTLASR